MTTAASLILAFAPLSGDATPTALGLGHELLIQSEQSCGSFCLGSSNSHFDILLNANLSQAHIPQPAPKQENSIRVSPVEISTFDVSWHPFHDFAVGSGYRTSRRSSERNVAGKRTRLLAASTLEVPLTVSARPSESFSLAGRVTFRKIELKQTYMATAAAKTESYSSTPHRWSVDALWQKSENTGYAVSYTSSAEQSMTAIPASGSSLTTSKSTKTPKWTDPQEFTFSMARLASIQPPKGVTFGPFENIFHLSVSSATWESGSPVAYAALTSGTDGKDPWSLTGPADQTQEFVFDTLDPSLATSAGLESIWMRNRFLTLSTFTHVRLNHLAAKQNSTAWQGGFGLGLSTRYFSLQASTIWRNQDAGYAFGLSASL
jgi:hypothetical protein